MRKPKPVRNWRSGWWSAPVAADGTPINIDAEAVEEICSCAGIAPGAFRVHGWTAATTNKPRQPAADALLAAVADLLGAWPNLRAVEVTRPRPRNQRAALDELLETVDRLRTQLDTLDDASRDALKMPQYRQDGKPLYYPRTDLSRIRECLDNFQTDLVMADRGLEGRSSLGPPVEPGRKVFLALLMNIYEAHAHDASRGSRDKRVRFARQVCELAGVPVPDDDPKLAALIRPRKSPPKRPT